MITTKRQVWGWTIFVTLFALVFVSSVVMLLYPMSEWAWELSVSFAITTMLTVPISHFIGLKQFEVSSLNEELQRLVSRDRLTDVATRDFFFDRMENNVDSYGISLMVDIDHFKNVNDTYGHFAGDEVIRHVASILRAEVRAADIVCRFGGEEFVIFLHEVDKDTGLLVAERIRMSVEKAPAISDGQQISVTVSIGGSLKDAYEDINSSIKLADEALYRAKSLGRNRTIVDWLPTALTDRKVQAAE